MRNLEAKFRLSDLDAARAAALGLGYAVRQSFTQRDTFFKVVRGKLKLREQRPEAWLIHYQRDAESGLMLSRYEIAPVADAGRTRAMLERALGVLAEVRKHRELLTRRNVRFHLDRVEKLGGFGEIEALLDDGPQASAGAASARAAIDELLAALGVGASDLIERSYFELMTRD
jgi:predicted adenylyl cyclase CyaB